MNAGLLYSNTLQESELKAVDKRPQNSRWSLGCEGTQDWWCTWLLPWAQTRHLLQDKYKDRIEVGYSPNFRAELNFQALLEVQESGGRSRLKGHDVPKGRSQSTKFFGRWGPQHIPSAGASKTIQSHWDETVPQATWIYFIKAFQGCMYNKAIQQ